MDTSSKLFVEVVDYLFSIIVCHTLQFLVQRDLLGVLRVELTKKVQLAFLVGYLFLNVGFLLVFDLVAVAVFCSSCLFGQ